MQSHLITVRVFTLSASARQRNSLDCYIKGHQICLLALASGKCWSALKHGNVVKKISRRNSLDVLPVINTNIAIGTLLHRNDLCLESCLRQWSRCLLSFYADIIKKLGTNNVGEN
jgi:hypothetical protein